MASAGDATVMNNKKHDEAEVVTQNNTTNMVSGGSMNYDSGIKSNINTNNSNSNNNILRIEKYPLNTDVANKGHSEASSLTPIKESPTCAKDISIHRAPRHKNRLPGATAITNISSDSKNNTMSSDIQTNHDIDETDRNSIKSSVQASIFSNNNNNSNNIMGDARSYNSSSKEDSPNLNTNKNVTYSIPTITNTHLNKDSQMSTTPSKTDKSFPEHSKSSSKEQKEEFNESHIEPSSVNTSHISETSSGSASSEECSYKTESLNFSDPRQRQVFEALTGIQSLRKGGQFNDVTIRVKDQEFRCHRFVLSNCSPFFRSLVNDKWDNEERENNTDEHAKETSVLENDSSDVRRAKATVRNSAIVLNGVEPHIFEKVLDFIYCVFDDVISDNTTLELLLAADTFQLSNLSQTCVTHIAETICVDNVFDIISLVDSGCTSLCDNKVRLRCHQVLRENFLQLCCKNEFLGLNRQRMISLVADSMLAIKNEMDLIQPLIRWVSIRPSERCADLTLMLQLIRFPLMKSEDLDKLLEIPFLKENSLAAALVDESKTYGLKDFPEKLSWPRQNCISRCQFPSRDFILWTADRNKGLHLYSIIDGLHYKVTTFNETTVANTGFTFDSTSTVCCYGDRLFFTGGEFNTDLAWSVDSGTGEVSVHAKMPRGRKFHSMVVSRGFFYCLGGQDKRGYTVLDSVDAYIISKDLWLKVGHMAVAAYNMTAVMSNGAIYLIGGVDHSGQPLRLIQCFAVLRSGLYSAFKVDITNMPPSLLSARAVTSGLDGVVHIVCGHGEVYRLDVEKQFLHHVSTLKSLSKNPRVRFGLAHVGGCLVITGGIQLGHMTQEPIRSICMDIASKAEVKDYSPLLPADIVNTCFYAKLKSGILDFSKLSNPSH